MLAKLKEHDAEFRRLHLAIVDITDDDESLEAEQVTLDTHDDLVASLTICIMVLIETTNPACPLRIEGRELLARKCTRLESCLTETSTALTPGDKFQLQQYHDQLLDYKSEFSEIDNTLQTLTLEESDSLPVKISQLERGLFECSLRHKELCHTAPSPTTTTPSDPRGIKLPKIDVPQFNSNILSWTRFWEQFRISVHECPNLSDAEKFVSLQQALKNGSDKSSIDRLSQSGDNYPEAVACLKTRYDHPRLIHKAHVKMILEAPLLKEGTRKELRALHDSVQQRVRALKSIGYEPSGPFIISALELKLDETTMFEWQKHS